MNAINYRLWAALVQAAADSYRTATISCAATDTQTLVRALDGTYATDGTNAGASSGADAKTPTTGNGAIAVAFRGTNDFSKWVGDAEVDFVRPNDLPAGEGKWHQGVSRAVCSTRAQLASMLRTFPERTPIYFTGHSFGGGCAPAAAYLCSLLGFSVAGVVTFAGMRFGDKVFEQNYNAVLGDRTWRMVAQYDVVPHLPLPTLLLPYGHVGTEVYFATGADGLSDVRVTVGRTVPEMLWQDAAAIFRALSLARAGYFLRLPVELSGMHSVYRYRQLVQFKMQN